MSNYLYLTIGAKQWKISVPPTWGDVSGKHTLLDSRFLTFRVLLEVAP